jgi:hypothetical protein
MITTFALDEQDMDGSGKGRRKNILNEKIWKNIA